MAFYDNTQVGTTLDEMLDRYFNLKMVPQMHRIGKTARHFNARKVNMRGKAYQFPCLIAFSSGTRRRNFNTARTSEAPAALDFDTQQVTVTFADFSEFIHTVQINDLDQTKTEDREMAVVNLADKVIAECEGDMSAQMNAAIFQPQTAAMFTVKQIYDVDGSAFTGAAGAAAAYIAIQGGSIAQLGKGDVVDIYDSSSTGGSDTLNKQVTVNAVNYGNDGPPVGDGTQRVADIGPGFIATPVSGNWNAVATPAVGDFIARSSEFSTDTAAPPSIHGFPDWFSETVNVYRQEDATLLDRDAAANQWMLPEVFDYTSSSVAVTFDPITHFRDAEQVLPRRIETARLKRSDEGPAMSKAMLCIASPEILTEATRAATGTEMFTSVLNMGLDEAKTKDLIGQSGFDGFVYHSPTLPPIAIQPDEACPPERIYLLEPNSWFWLHFSGAPGELNWEKQGNSRWVRKTGTNGRLTHVQNATAFFFACLMCDQMAANAMIKGVKASNQ